MDKFKKKDVIALYKSFESDGDNSFFVDPETGHFAFRGVVSNEEMDRDGDIVTAKAMAEATKEYLEFGSLREMHAYDNVVGKVKKVWQEGKKTFIEAFVVDPLTVEKIKTKVLTGLSIGFCVLERDENNKNIFTKIKWFETSVVDIPSNYSAHIAAKNAKIKIEEEDMDKENDKNVAQDQATQKANNDVATPTQTDVPAQNDTISKEEVQALEAEAIDQLTKELEEVKKSFEAVKIENESLKADATAKEEEFASTKELAKGYKSLSVVHKKYKEENEQLKADMVTLKAELEALKNSEVNTKTSAPTDVVKKSVDASKYIVNEAPKELMSATAIINAKMFK